MKYFSYQTFNLISEHFQDTSQCQYCLFYFLKCSLALWFLHASSALQHYLLHSLLPGHFWDRSWLSSVHSGCWNCGCEVISWDLRHRDIFLKATLVASCWWFGCCSLVYLLHLPLEPEVFLCTSVWITWGYQIFHSFSLIWSDLRTGPCTGMYWDPGGSWVKQAVEGR